MAGSIRRVALGAVAAASLVGGLAGAAVGEPFSVRLDKVEVLRLDGSASIVVVGNPGIADVTVENPRLLFVIGHAPGETNLIVLDADGQEIANLELIVVGERERHVTVNRSASLLTTFSCDPRCIEVPNPSEIERQRQFAGAPTEDEGAPAPPAEPQAAPQEVAPAEEGGGEQG